MTESTDPTVTAADDLPSADPAERTMDCIAASLLAEAQHIDPGLRSASLPPIGSGQRERFERVRDHYIAYGIRHALDNLGLMPDE